MKSDLTAELILGIDPGSQSAGYALIRCSTHKSFSVVDSGVCKLAGKTDFFLRLAQLSCFFTELTQQLKTFDVAIEGLAYVKNVNSFAKLAQARGAIIAAIYSQSKGLYEYPPNLVKSTVAGYGHASKKGIEKSLKLSGENRNYSSHDESDALAIAICHHFHRGQTTSIKSRGRSLKEIFKGKNI